MVPRNTEMLYSSMDFANITAKAFVLYLNNLLVLTIVFPRLLIIVKLPDYFKPR